jgi:hypothetical protein
MIKENIKINFLRSFVSSGIIGIFNYVITLNLKFVFINFVVIFLFILLGNIVTDYLVNFKKLNKNSKNKNI